MFWRYLPLTGMVLMVLIAACVRPWLQFRRHGTFGIHLFGSGSRSQNLRDGAFVLQIALLIGQAAAAASGGRAPHLLIASQGLLHGVLQWAGAVLLLGGIALLAYAGARVQAAAEEAYLDRTYGKAFRAYARCTGRFLPGIGRP